MWTINTFLKWEEKVNKVSPGKAKFSSWKRVCMRGISKRDKAKKDWEVNVKHDTMNASLSGLGSWALKEYDKENHQKYSLENLNSQCYIEMVELKVRDFGSKRWDDGMLLMQWRVNLGQMWFFADILTSELPLIG